MTLYKYLEPARIDVLENRKIRFSQINALNDPFEGKPYYARLASDERILAELQLGDENLLIGVQELGVNFVDDFLAQFQEMLPNELQAEMKQIRDELPSKDKLLQEVQDGYSDNIQKTLIPLSHEMMPFLRPRIAESFNQAIGILCLSKSHRNNLMWAHYARNSQGFVLGINDRHPFFNKYGGGPDKVDSLWPVEYSKKRPQQKNLLDLSIDDVVFTKPSDWAYEEEWRIIKKLGNENLLIDIEGRPLVDELNEPIHLITFPVDAIESVFIGSRINELNRARLLKSLSPEDFSHINVFQARESERYYELHFDKI